MYVINQVAFFYEEESLVVCSGPALKNLHFFAKTMHLLCKVLCWNRYIIK